MHPSVSVDLYVVIPVYNEEAALALVVRDWLECFDRLDLRDPERACLLLIDDGSTDATSAILTALCASDARLRRIRQPNSGHGAAVLRGYREAIQSGARWVFQVDSDGQFVAADFPRLWERREQSRFLIGRRTRRADSLPRIFVSAGLRSVLRVVFRVSVPDSNVPYRLMEGRYLSSLLTRLPRGLFVPNVVLSILAARDGLELGSVPITHRPRGSGVSLFAGHRLFRFSFRVLRELISFRLALRAASR